jgi:hypothetical protein
MIGIYYGQRFSSDPGAALIGAKEKAPATKMVI